MTEMRGHKVQSWINIAASLSVLIGLILVAIELRQTNDLALAETVRSLWEVNTELQKFEIENRILPLVRKSVENPNDLTDDEIDTLDTYYQIVFSFHITFTTMREDFGLAYGNTQDQAQKIVEDYLYNQFARGWYNASEYWIAPWSPELAREISKILENTPIENEYLWPAEIRRHSQEAVINSQ